MSSTTIHTIFGRSAASTGPTPAASRPTQAIRHRDMAAAPLLPGYDLHQSDVDVLPPARLPAVDGDHVLSGPERLPPLRGQSDHAVVGHVPAVAAGQDAVHVDLHVLVVVYPPKQLARRHVLQLDLPAEPDVRRIPGRADDGPGRHRRPEPAL